jgi:hypothetical protein
VRAGVADAEHGEEEGEEGDAQEQEHADGNENADAAAPAAAAAPLELEVVGWCFGRRERAGLGREVAGWGWRGHGEWPSK